MLIHFLALSWVVGCLIAAAIASHSDGSEERRHQRALVQEQRRLDRQARIEFNRLPREAKRAWHRSHA